MPINSVLSCLDHDMQSKSSLTPSIILDVDIPENFSGSFYRDKVPVTIKDSIFQPSIPLRHAAELKNVLEETTQKGSLNLILTENQIIELAIML